MAQYQRVSRHTMGDRLRQALEESDLTPTQVAAELGYTTAGIAHWISGRGEIPSGYLPALASMTGKSVLYFLGVDNPERSEAVQGGRPARVTRSSHALHLVGPELAFANGLGEIAEQHGKTLEVDVTDYQEAIPSIEIASRLGIKRHERCLYRARVQIIDGQRVRWIGSWMPLDLFGPVVDQRPTNRPLFEIFEEQTGIQITKVDERLRIVSADTVGVTEALRVSDQEAVWAIQRMVHTSIDRVGEFAVIYALPAYWEFAYSYPAARRKHDSPWSWVDGTSDPINTAP